MKRKKKEIFMRRKSIESMKGFIEPQWQILKFLTQFYTFKKFERRLLSSCTKFSFPHTHYIKALK